MSLSRFQSVAILLVSVVAVLGGLSMNRALAEDAKKKPAIPENSERIEGNLHAINVAKSILTIRTGTKVNGQKTEEDRTVEVAADAKIVVSAGGKQGDKGVKLGDLTEGMRVTVWLSADKKAAISVAAAIREKTMEGSVKSINAAQGTIVISSKDKDSKQKVEKQFVLPANVQITIAGHPKAGEKISKTAAANRKVTDLKEGMSVSLVMSQDEKDVVAVRVAAPTTQGILKSVDAAKGRITVTHGAKDNAEDKTYDVAKETSVIVDGKEGQLSDLKEGMPLFLLLSAEEKALVGIRAGDKGKVKVK